MIVLFTGRLDLDPQNPDDVATVEQALRDATAGRPGQHTLREGGAPGGDTIARRLAHQWGWRVDTHPADWRAPCRDTCKPGHRRRNHAGIPYCPAAGNYRNQAMVDLGADKGVAVRKKGAANRGTNDCTNRMADAGIDILPRTAPAASSRKGPSQLELKAS